MKRLTLVLLTLLFCTTAHASSVTVQGGWDHTPNSNYGDSTALNARFEAPIYPSFSIATEVSYHPKQSHAPYGNLSGESLLGEVLYRPVSTWKLTPYVLAGAGWSWWDWGLSQDMKDKGIEINIGNAFAQKYGIGADYPLGDNWFLNVEWYYFHANVPKDSFYSNGSGFANVAGGSSIGQEETVVVAGLKKVF